MADETKTKTPENTEGEAQTKTETEDKGEKLVTIKLPITRENQKDVFVRVNHRTWLIKRGEYVQVPECVVEVLSNSEKAVLEGIEYQKKVQK